MTGNDIAEVQQLKESSVKILTEATFQWHKLHSNKQELEKEDNRPNDEEQSFAKQQLGVSSSDTKGHGWKKSTDTIYINTRLKKKEELTKRDILAKLASIYDPLGLLSPVTLIRKMILEMPASNMSSGTRSFP